MSAVELTSLFGFAATAVGGAFAVVKWRGAATIAAALRLQSAAREALANDANLRDDQRNFIRVLQEENANWRVQVEALHRDVDRLRETVDSLRHDLAVERLSREADARHRRRDDPT